MRRPTLRSALASPDGQGYDGVLQGLPRTAVMRGKLGDALAFSADAAIVRFGLEYGEAKPVIFDLLAGSLGDLRPARPPGLRSHPRVSKGCR